MSKNIRRDKMEDDYPEIEVADEYSDAPSFCKFDCEAEDYEKCMLFRKRRWQDCPLKPLSKSRQQKKEDRYAVVYGMTQ